MRRLRRAPTPHLAPAVVVAVVALLVGACRFLGGPVTSFDTPMGSGSVAPLGTAGEPGATGTVSSPTHQAPGSTLHPATIVRIVGYLTSGPTCPVDIVPPKPACAPRPVAGATVVATDQAGRAVARTSSGGDGYYVLAVGAGTYIVIAEPVPGLRHAPAPKRITVPTEGGRDVTVDFQYDTGMR